MKPTARKRRLERVLTATVAVGVLPMIFGAPPASATPDAPSDTPSQAQWQALDKVVTAHSALGVFGLTDTVLMLPAGTSAEEKSRVQAEIPAGMKVAVKISKFAKGEADEVQKSVMSGEWNTTGEKLGLVAAYDGQTDTVHVAVEGPRSATEALQKRYAGKVEAGPGRGTPQYGRYADSVPFWGGSSIKDPLTGSTCTAGYAVRDNVTGKTKMVTAGHCATLWAQFQTQDGRYYGNVERRRKDLDVELISNSYGMDYHGSIWTGGIWDSYSSLQVTDWSGWTFLGKQLCVSGQTTFNHCGHPVSANGVAISYNAFGEWNTIKSEAAYMMDRGGTDPCHCNGKFTAPGDSGAPVYELSSANNGSAKIMGHHHGKFWWKGYDRMVNVKPGSVLVDWNLRMMFGSN